jgi:hypothetical protein
MAAFEAHVHENPLVGHLTANGDGSPMMISDFLSQERFHRLGVYAEFYRHVPVEYQIAIGLPSPDGRVIGIALNRVRSDFTEEERDLLADLPAIAVARRGVPCVALDGEPGRCRAGCRWSCLGICGPDRAGDGTMQECDPKRW